MQFFKGAPQGGLWTVTINVSGPVNGTHLSEPFTGNISFAPPPVSASGIPTSRHTKLRAGQPVTATIQVTNNGNIRKDYLADPRLDGRVPQLLVGADTNNVGLPLSLSAQPNWLVPPGHQRRSRRSRRRTSRSPARRHSSPAIRMSAACRSVTPR